ncbi:discoidin domain-containing protein [Leucothrix arctica]|uniref:F5/8 type C domain-containing protein n=1 Tax=Leucothrix arctica TaxID=1481894 RepID=A0A317CG66_9GAMM|nr:discoidin domain-containing protein [Leucothrix arctica]PWQ97151.1 hypothetical protein DKT75_07495 [Leucothrix arctica]
MKQLNLTRRLSAAFFLLASLFCYSSANADITIDGDITDWSSEDRLELSPRTPVDGYELFGRYESNSYKILLRNLTGTISTSTTFWLNTDQDSATGYLIWGYAGGAEYNVNIAADGQPYLYQDADGQTLVSGPLAYNISTDGSGENIELEIPESLIGTPTGDGVNMLIDVNNTSFLPASYWPHENNYILAKETVFDGAGIVIDGDKSDWNASYRVDLDETVATADAEIYARFEDNTYKFLIHDSSSSSIGEGSTIWLNTDNDLTTGEQVLGYAGGAEYNINFAADGKPYLYTGGAGETLVDGPLNYATVTDSFSATTLEIELAASLVGSPSGEGITFILDNNGSSYFPRSYFPNTNNYTLLHETETAQIAIVYSATSEAQFFDSKAYAQLFMSVQAQAMMAGLPFDLLTEDDLLDLDKIKNYKTLVFPYAANAPADIIAGIEQNLTTAVNDYNVGIVTAGNFLTNDETGTNLSDDAYLRMKSLMGITRTDGGGPFSISYQVSNSTHPVTSSEFATDEVLKTYTAAYTDYFVATGDYPSTVLAQQVIDGTSVQNALIVTENGGRHAHFGTVQLMTDPNILWSVLQWSVYGEKAPVALHMTRENSVFVGRNDMDQSMFIDQAAEVEGELLTYLQLWKTNYDFVSSYYINVGNDADNQEETDWAVSGPLYQQYMALGNEIGTHSYTHPHDTNILTDAELEEEFADSRTIIEENLNITNLSAAVPGAAEDLRTAGEIIQHVDYLSGGYSGTGAGYPNAIGFLDPSYSKVYLSPNMSFDFTLVEFQNKTAAEAEATWFSEFDELVKHSNLGLIHWPWHDYGPTNSDNGGYTFAMFDNLLAKAHDFGSEFITGKDFAERIKSFKSTGLNVTKVDDVITAQVSSSDTGKFALNVADGETITSVDDWYAYNDTQVFLANTGREYKINLGATNTAVTRITELPKRGELVTLTGDGTDLAFEFKGEGTVNIQLACVPDALTVTGGTDQFSYITTDTIAVSFTGDIQHATTTVDATCSVTLSLAEVQVFGSEGVESTNLALTGTATQSTTAYSGVASRAIDGNTSGEWNEGTVTHTNATSTTAWWELELPQNSNLEQIVLFNRTNCCTQRLSDFTVSVLDEAGSVVWSQLYAETPSPSLTISLTATGKTVRVSLDGTATNTNVILSLAEVQIYGTVAVTTDLTNLALSGIASQSTTDYSGVASRAIDGNTSGAYSQNSVTHTNSSNTTAWWQVVLPQEATIGQIALFNRTDSCCTSRLTNFTVSVLDDAENVIWSQFYSSAPSPSQTISLSATGSIVRVSLGSS